jgi:hypothetical protein
MVAVAMIDQFREEFLQLPRCFLFHQDPSTPSDMNANILKDKSCLTETAALSER